MQRYAFKIHSTKLDATIWLAMSRNAARQLWVNGVRDAIFLPEDIEAIKGIPDAGLRAVHAAKLEIPGCMIEPWQPEEPQPPAEEQLGLGIN